MSILPPPPPQKGLEFPGGVGGSGRPKTLKKCMKFNWNFQRGGEVLEKIPSVGEVWLFSGTAHWLPARLTVISKVDLHSNQ